MTQKENEISKTIELSTRKPDYESISKGLCIYLNKAKDNDRVYAVIIDNKGQKFYLNKRKEC